MKQESVTEAYLRRATRGLWGRRRREVREELEAHLHERVMAHRIAGLSEVDATEKALAELGRPQEVSVGMARLYTLPTMMSSGLVTASLCLAVLALWPKGMTQSVAGTFFWPSVDCIDAVAKNSVQNRNQACFWTMDSFWVNQEELRSALEPQGVKVSDTSIPGASAEGDSLLSVTFPGSVPIYVTLGSPDFHYMDEDGRRIPTATGYFSLWDLLQNVSQRQEINVSVTGWDNPTVSFNDVSFQIGTESARIPGTRFYTTYLSAILEREFGRSIFDTINAWSISPPPLRSVPHTGERLAVNQRTPRLLDTTVTLRQAEEGVYGIATYLDPNSGLAKSLSPGDHPIDAFFLVQPARLSKNGTISVQLPDGSSTFIERFGRKLVPNTSMLMRLSGGASSAQGWFEVVSPERITLEPTP